MEEKMIEIKMNEAIKKMGELRDIHDRVAPCREDMTEREFDLYMTGISRGGSQAYKQAIKIIEVELGHERN